MADKYVEIALGHPKNRGVVIPLPELSRHMIDGQPLFRSYYSFDEELVEHFKVRKTIKNYHGKYYLDRIIFDIDKGSENSENCLENSKQFLNSLIQRLEEAEVENVENYIQPWFSGRGYHYSIPNVFGFVPSNDLPKIVKKTLEEYFPEADHIYDGARLIRVGFTINEKSKLYKIPLDIPEILYGTAEEIEMLASKPEERPAPIPLLEPESLLEIVEPKEEESEVVIHEFNPSAVVTCVQKMYAEGDVKGSRHTKALRIASYMLRSGIPIDATKVMLQHWAKSLDTAETNRITDDTYRGVYRYGCFDAIMDKYCDVKCIYYPMKEKRQDMLMPVMSASEMESKYVERIRNLDRLPRINLADIYLLEQNFWMNPGEMIIVIGDTGMGKTAWVQNLVVENKVRTLWLSLEMPVDLMYRRFLQIARGETKEEIDAHYKVSDNAWSKLIEHINCVTIPPKIEQIRRLVAETQPTMLVVDTIDCVRVSKYIHDSMFKMDEIIAEIRDIATTQHVIVVGVSHTTKADSRTGALDVHSGKHSSSIAQKADQVIAVEGLRNSIARKITSKKTRDGNGLNIVCNFTPDTFRFKQETTERRN